MRILSDEDVAMLTKSAIAMHVFCGDLQPEELDDDKRLYPDSLELAELAFQLEGDLGLEADALGDLDRLRTVGDFVRRARKAYGKASRDD